MTFNETAEWERREALRMARYAAVVLGTQAAIAAAEEESRRACERDLIRRMRKRQPQLEFSI